MGLKGDGPGWPSAEGDVERHQGRKVVIGSRCRRPGTPGRKTGAYEGCVMLPFACYGNDCNACPRYLATLSERMDGASS
jgi:hypothetical protein